MSAEGIQGLPHLGAAFAIRKATFAMNPPIRTTSYTLKRIRGLDDARKLTEECLAAWNNCNHTRAELASAKGNWMDAIIFAGHVIEQSEIGVLVEFDRIFTLRRIPIRFNGLHATTSAQTRENLCFVPCFRRQACGTVALLSEGN